MPFDSLIPSWFQVFTFYLAARTYNNIPDSKFTVPDLAIAFREYGWIVFTLLILALLYINFGLSPLERLWALLRSLNIGKLIVLLKRNGELKCRNWFIKEFVKNHVSDIESLEKPCPNEGKIMVSQYRIWLSGHGVNIFIAPMRSGKLPNLTSHKKDICARVDRILKRQYAKGFEKYKPPKETWRLIDWRPRKGVLFSYQLSVKN